MSIWASTNYAPLIKDTEQRLDKTAELYQQQHTNEARHTVRMAYFEVLENLEGPIRVNVSARKSYEMESAFGEVYWMVSEKRPLTNVQARIDWLKAALRKVEPVLDGGHRLMAEERYSTLSRDDVTVHRQESSGTIDDLLAQAVIKYQAGNYSVANQHVQQAHYQGFKSSEVEMPLRQNRFTRDATSINQQFSSLITLAAQPDHLNDVPYQVTTPLQGIEDILPGLPTTRDGQQVAATQDTDNIPTADEGNNRTDWVEVTMGISQSIQGVIARYQGGDAKNTILNIQDTYFDHFETSGMENKIGSHDSTFKTTLETCFTRLVSLVKAGQPVERLNAEASAPAQDLQRTVTMLGEGEETWWSLLLYSLMIIVRGGLETLLTVVITIAYMVKNSHQDRLSLIRQPVIVALIASVITAAIFQMLFTNSGTSRELLGGITMLIAVVMLFFMSYWLLSKVEARYWKAWLGGELSHSLSRDSLVGLWLTSFLVVYREGAGTVLLYYVLVNDANTVSGHMAIGTDFVIDYMVLLLAWLMMRYSVVRLPLKPFFMFTGSLMYLMAFVFAGKGILELAEGKLFQSTLINGFLEISWLGIYPYVEALLPQVVLLLAALVTLWVMRRKSAVPGEAIKNNP